MEIQVAGSGPSSNIEAQVEPSYQGIRESFRPLDHNVGGVLGGTYGVMAGTGLIAVQTAASSALFAVRFVSSTKLMVLLKLTVGLNVTTAYSAATDGGEPDIEMYLAKSYISNPSAGGTALAPSTTSLAARDTMAPSEFVSNGAILAANTGALTPGTQTLDSYPYTYGTFSAGGRALGSLGTVELFNNNKFGQHPLIFSSNQGFILRNTRQFAGAAGTGVSRLQFAMEWAEVAAY